MTRPIVADLHYHHRPPTFPFPLPISHRFEAMLVVPTAAWAGGEDDIGVQLARSRLDTIAEMLE